MSDDRANAVALYTRVSTNKQDEMLQLPRLRRLAETRGLTVYREYMDEASGKDQNRPAWKDLMRDAKEGCFGCIMAVKLDRVMRSVVNLNTVMSQLKVYNVRLITEDMGEIDPSKPNGKLIMQVIGAIAEWERETISSRTKDSLEEKKAQGIRLGRKSRDDIPLAEIAEMRASGLSWNAIVKRTGIPKGTLFSRKEEIEKYPVGKGYPSEEAVGKGRVDPGGSSI